MILKEKSVGKKSADVKERPLRVAMIGLRGIPGTSGGVEVAVEHIAPLLVEQGIDMTVYCRSSYCASRQKNFKGVKLIYLKTLNTKFTEALVHSFLSTAHALFCRYDVIHYHALGNGIFALFPRLFGTKTVVTVHGMDYQREKWGLVAKKCLQASERVIGWTANAVISVSKKIKRHYKDVYNKEDVSYIPNGVIPPPKMSVTAIQSLDYGNPHIETGQYYLFLSRLVPEKGIDVLIRAFKNLDTKKKLVIVGDHTHTQDYVMQVKKLAADDDRIIFTGGKFGKEKDSLFRGAYCFILPSSIEGLPIVLLEAMSYGIPCVVSNIEESMDVTLGDEYAFDFKVGSVEDLQKVLAWCDKHPEECKAKGEKAQAMVLELYKWERVAKHTKQVYEDVTSKGVSQLSSWKRDP